MATELRERLINEIETLAKSKNLCLISPKYTMINLNTCMICNRIGALNQVTTLYRPPMSSNGVIICCNDHVKDAELSIIRDSIDILGLSLYNETLYVTNHGESRVVGVRISRSAYPGKPVLEMLCPSEYVSFCRTYSQFLETNTVQDLEKVLESIGFPEDYPLELIEIFKTI